MCKIEVEILFLMLASAMTMTVFGLEEELSSISLSLLICELTVFLSFQYTVWKEK